jgi:hypothetical protein
MPMKEASISLSKHICDRNIVRHDSHRSGLILTHGNAKQADDNLDAGNPQECLEDTGLYYPAVGAPREPKGEEILWHALVMTVGRPCWQTNLENEDAGERFDSDLSYAIVRIMDNSWASSAYDEHQQYRDWRPQPR